MDSSKRSGKKRPFPVIPRPWKAGELEDGLRLWHRMGEAIGEAKLRRSMNAERHTNQLPPEILSEIFLSCWSPYNRKWLVITEVCHHWRQVALLCPRLWSQIDLGHPASASYFLSRAKATSLYLTARRGKVDNLVANKCLQMMDRVTLIDIHERRFDPPFVVGSPIPSRVSPLRSFRMGAGWGPLGLFKNCEFPVIRELVIKCYQFQHDTVPFCLLGSTLTRLKLCGLTLSDFPHFVNLLSRMSGLEHLELWGVELKASGHRKLRGSISEIVLPKLQTLRIRPFSPGNSQSYDLHLQLLSQLIIPPNTHLCIVFDEGITQPERIAKYCPLFTLLGRLTKRTVYISFNPNNSSITFWPTKVNNFIGHQAKTHSEIVFRFGLTHLAATFDFFNGLPVHDVELLNVEFTGMDPEATIQWELVLRSFTRVKEFIVGRSVIGHLGCALQTRIHSDDGEIIPSMPLLENIYICYKGQQKIHSICLTKPLMESIIDGLMARTEYGDKVKTFYFIGLGASGDIRWEGIDRLRDVVSVVTTGEIVS